MVCLAGDTPCRASMWSIAQQFDDNITTIRPFFSVPQNDLTWKTSLTNKINHRIVGLDILLHLLIWCTSSFISVSLVWMLWDKYIISQCSHKLQTDNGTRFTGDRQDEITDARCSCSTRSVRVSYSPLWKKISK